MKDFERFIRIVKNGRKAGVYVLASSTLDDISDRHFSEVFGEIQLEMQIIAVENMSVKLKENALIRLNTSIERNKLDTVFSLLRGKKEQKEIIPFRRYLPQVMTGINCVQTKKSLFHLELILMERIAVLKISSEKLIR